MTEWDRYYMNLYKVEPEMDDVDRTISNAMSVLIAGVVGSVISGVVWIIWKIVT